MKRLSVIDFDNNRLDIQLLLSKPIDKMVYESKVRLFMLDKHNWKKSGDEIILKSYHDRQLMYVNGELLTSLGIRIIGVKYDKYYDRILSRYKQKKVMDAFMSFDNGAKPTPDEYIESIKVSYNDEFFIPITVLYPLSKKSVFNASKKASTSFMGVGLRRCGLEELKDNINRDFWNKDRITYFSTGGLTGGTGGSEEVNLVINIQKLFKKTHVFSDPEVGNYPGEAGSSYFVINGIPKEAIVAIAVSNPNKRGGIIRDYFNKGLIKDSEVYYGPNLDALNDIKRLKIKV